MPCNAIKYKRRMKVRTSAEKSREHLSYEQVQRLASVIEEEREIHGRGNFPTLQVCLRDLIEEVTRRIGARGIKLSHVKLNGGAATHVVSSYDLPFNDIDLIFGIDLSTSSSLASSSATKATSESSFDAVRAAVLDSLLEFLPTGTNKSKINESTLTDAYVRKLVKVEGDLDRWSLISLNNEYGRSIELKFVEKMRRQFEFSVDSFQIDLGSLLTFSSLAGFQRGGDVQPRQPALTMETPTSDFSESSSFIGDETADDDDDDTASSLPPLTMSVGKTAPRLTPNFFPAVIAESVFGDFRVALHHLNEKLIDTWHPEEIRGGGLLKYCDLLVRGYRPAVPRRLREMERYMCSRFFIDFPDVQQQEAKLESYLENHFRTDLSSKREYLLLLERIVDESTICLMNHERRMTLNMINCLAQDVLAELCAQRVANPFVGYPLRHGFMPQPKQPATIFYVPPSGSPQRLNSNASTNKRPQQCWVAAT